MCNGRLEKPYIPDVSGIESFTGQIMHSHEYKNSLGFEGKTVCLLGAMASGKDLSREISLVAQKCYLFAQAHMSPDDTPCGERKNIYKITGWPTKIDGTKVIFDSGEI